MSGQLDAAMSHALCVKAVMGHGRILMLGFGSEILPPPSVITRPGRRPIFKHHARPAYELQTEFARWWIEGPLGILVSRDGEYQPDIVASLLVRKQVMQWKFLHPGWGLCINFELDYVLRILPHDEASKNEVWGIWDSNNYFFEVKPSGEMFKIHGTEPVKWRGNE